MIGLVRAEGPSAGELVLTDNGVATRFEIAADELEIRGSATHPGPEKVPARGLSQLRTAIRERTTPDQEACLVLYKTGKARTRLTRRVLTREVVVRLAEGADPAIVLANLPDAESRGEFTFAPGFFLVISRETTGAPALAEHLRTRAGVRSAEVQLAKHYDLRFTPNDPYFPVQWHLGATAANSGKNAGKDLRVQSVWDHYRGAGIRIGIIDSGVQTSHPDLKPNIAFALAYDFVRNSTNVNPVNLLTEQHGTAVAGVAAARGNNGLGIAGVAYEAKLVPHRLLTDGPLTEVQIVSAFAHRTDAIHIKNNSWGPHPGGTNLVRAGELMPATLADTAAKGRGGRGTIHVFSAGNDGEEGGNVNYDNVLNTIWAVPVAAVAQDGSIAAYSRPGAALVVAAPGHRNDSYPVVTTDLRGGSYGYNLSGDPRDIPNRDYTAGFGGTSAAAPMVSGVVALMLQANPRLGWRDVQEILIRSARKNAPTNPGWATNSAGIKFHHQFGGGMVHAANAVAMAKGWVNLPRSTNQVVYASTDALAIPDNTQSGVRVPFYFTNENLRAEHVRLRVEIDHERRGDLEILLISPGGMVSRFAEKRNDLDSNYKGWIFMSRAHWGERANGVWTLCINDLAPGEGGMLLGARLEVLGTYVNRVRVDAVACREISGQANDNGYPDPGEILQQAVWLRNTSSGSITGLTATLSTSMPGVTVLSNFAKYPVIPAGGVASNKVAFRFEAAPELCGVRLPFMLVTSHGAVRTTNTFFQQLGRPVDDPQVINIFASEDVPKPVADLSTVTSEIAHPVAPDAVLDDVDVSVRIDHTTVGDLQLVLQHPDGTEVLLSDHRGSNNPNFGTGICGTDVVPVTFDDAASTAVADGAAPFAGSYRPEGLLAVLNGKPPGGTWRLRVSDTYDNDFGTLNCWSIRTVSHRRTIACEVFTGGQSHLVAANQPRIQRYQCGQDGTFEVQVEAVPGSEYVLEASTDLLHWVPVATYEAGTLPLALVDPNAAQYGQRFYRVHRHSAP